MLKKFVKIDSNLIMIRLTSFQQKSHIKAIN